MNRNRPITTIQVMAVIISTIIGIGILSIPRYMAEAGDSGAPLVTASGVPIAFWVAGLQRLSAENSRTKRYSYSAAAFSELGSRIYSPFLSLCSLLSLPGSPCANSVKYVLPLSLKRRL